MTDEIRINKSVIAPPEMLIKKGFGYECKCMTDRDYSKEFDAYYCPKCNWWLEEGCSGPTCEFCGKRPMRPL